MGRIKMLAFLTIMLFYGASWVCMAIECNADQQFETAHCESADFLEKHAVYDSSCVKNSAMFILEKLLKDSKWALYWAVTQRHLDVLELLIAHHVNLNEIYEGEKTLLHYALEKKYKDIVEILLKHKININLFDAQGNQPLHIAAADGDLGMLALLDAAGADLNDAAGDFLPRPIHAAAGHGHKEAVQWFLKKGIEIDTAEPGFGDYYATSVMHAANSGHWDLVQWLYQQGANIKECWMGGPPDYLINLAVAQCASHMVAWLLARGADPNQFGSLHTPIVQAAYQNNHECYDTAKLLLNAGASVNCDENSADLMIIRRGRNAEVIDLINDLCS